jgi:hypothetical protein
MGPVVTTSGVWRSEMLQQFLKLDYEEVDFSSLSTTTNNFA